MVRLFLLLLALSAGLCPAGELLREWKSADGQVRKMRLVESDGKTAKFVLGGRTVELPMERLAVEDQAVIRIWIKEEKARIAALPKPRVWPKQVEVKLSDFEIEELEAVDGWYLYQTDHYLFRSEERLSISLMREVSRVFEATRQLVEELPWAVDPVAPQKRYIAELYSSRASYESAGGPSNSGGVYVFGYEGPSHYGKFMVPFESIGVKRVGKRWVQDEDFTPDTLIHELAHQACHFSLFLVPKWFAEGSAEYCQVIPYHAGRFRVEGLKTASKEYLGNFARDRGAAPPLPQDIGAFLLMDDRTWDAAGAAPRQLHLMYAQAFMLFYYFAHLEEEGEATAFFKYCDRVNEIQQRWIDYSLAFRAYKDKFDAFLKHPDVKHHKDGRVEFPETMTMPEAPKNPFPGGVRIQKAALTKELINGRSAAELREQVIAGYRKIGVRIE